MNKAKNNQCDGLKRVECTLDSDHIGHLWISEDIMTQAEYLDSIKE